MSNIDSEANGSTRDIAANCLVDPRLLFLMTEVAQLRDDIGHPTVLGCIKAQMVRGHLTDRIFSAIDDQEDLDDIDVVRLQSYADRILRGHYVDRLAKRTLPFAAIHIILLRDNVEMDAQERSGIIAAISEQFSPYALQIVVDGSIVFGPVAIIDAVNRYWVELMRALIREAATVCDQELDNQETSAQSREFGARQARRQQLRDDLRKEVASTNDAIRGRIVQLLQGTRSHTQLIADLTAFDDYRKQRLQRALSNNALLPEIHSFAAHVDGFKPSFPKDSAAAGSLNNGLLSAVVGVLMLNPLAAIYSARGFLGAWLGSRRLSPGESSQLNERVAVLIQRDQDKMYQAIDAGLLATAAREPRWLYARTIRRAAALLRRLPAHG